ncbi:MAG: hypothetical protein IJX74_04450 [Clostridia bacterium]|nr:hypothetical protein [Clostridia bacterium]
MARGGISSKTKRLATAALLSALGVVLLELGALIEVFDMSAAIAASIIILPVLLEWGGKYPLLIFAVTGTIAIIIVPSNFAAWMYIGFLGYYPIIKLKYEKLKRPIAAVLKFLTMNAAIAVYALVLWFVTLGGKGSLADLFTQGFGGGEDSISVALGWILLVLVEIIFIVYDFLLTRIIIIYNYRWRQKFQKFLR